MKDTGNLSSVTNVFVLMLENHSFDNIFAMSGLPCITAATTADLNKWTAEPGGPTNTYHVRDGAPPFMTTDPAHEFRDVMEQLQRRACPFVTSEKRQEQVGLAHRGVLTGIAFAHA